MAKVLGGLLDLTLNEKSVKKWAYDLHICTEIIHDLEKMRTKDDPKKNPSPQGRNAL